MEDPNRNTKMRSERLSLSIVDDNQSPESLGNSSYQPFTLNPWHSHANTITGGSTSTDEQIIYRLLCTRHGPYSILASDPVVSKNQTATSTDGSPTDELNSLLHYPLNLPSNTNSQATSILNESWTLDEIFKILMYLTFHSNRPPSPFILEKTSRSRFQTQSPSGTPHYSLYWEPTVFPDLLETPSRKLLFYSPPGSSSLIVNLEPAEFPGILSGLFNDPQSRSLPSASRNKFRLDPGSCCYVSCNPAEFADMVNLPQSSSRHDSPSGVAKPGPLCWKQWRAIQEVAKPGPLCWKQWRAAQGVAKPGPLCWKQWRAAQGRGQAGKRLSWKKWRRIQGISKPGPLCWKLWMSSKGRERGGQPTWKTFRKRKNPRPLI